MGPAVFVLRESTSRSMKQLRADRPGEEKGFYCRRGPPQGEERGQGGRRRMARMDKILG